MHTSKQLKRRIAKVEKMLSNKNISVHRFAAVDNELRALKSQLASQLAYERDRTSYMRKLLK